MVRHRRRRRRRRSYRPTGRARLRFGGQGLGREERGRRDDLHGHVLRLQRLDQRLERCEVERPRPVPVRRAGRWTGRPTARNRPPRLRPPWAFVPPGGTATPCGRAWAIGGGDHRGQAPGGGDGQGRRLAAVAQALQPGRDFRRHVGRRRVRGEREVGQCDFASARADQGGDPPRAGPGEEDVLCGGPKCLICAAFTQGRRRVSVDRSEWSAPPFSGRPEGGAFAAARGVTFPRHSRKAPPSGRPLNGGGENSVRANCLHRAIHGWRRAPASGGVSSFTTRPL